VEIIMLLPLAAIRRLRGLQQRSTGVRERGQALVEFAMILPIMLLLICALVDFGRAYYTWLMVTNAAREGARVGATQQPESAINARILDSIDGLDGSELTINVTNAQGPRGEPINVDLTYNFEFVTPISSLLALVGGDALAEPQIEGYASMRLE